MIASILYSIVIGLIVGSIWSFSLNVSITNGLLWGTIVFIVICLIMSLIGKEVQSHGNVTKGESGFVSNSMLTMLGVIFIIIGLIVWTIRSIF